MKILKTGGLVVLAIIGLLLILGLLAPRQVDTMQSMVMEVPQSAAFSAVNNLKAWEEWEPWSSQDETTVMTFSDPSSGKGASYAWTSENSGEGTITITDTWPSDSLHTYVDLGPMGSADSRFLFLPHERGTEVQWHFHTAFPYPFNAMLLFSDFKGEIDKNYKLGLELMNEYVRANTPTPTPTGSYSVTAMDFPATHYLADRATVSMANLDAHFQERMPQLGMAVGQNGLEMLGMPAGLYYRMDKEEVDIALAIPTAAGATAEGFITIDLPAARALKIDYYGDYDGITAAHAAMDKYVQENQLAIKMPIIEVYKTDPGVEDDPSKWLTEVIYFPDDE